jgi:hypothetical protein
MLTDAARHAHCTFCGGIGAGLQAEVVISPVTGIHYRVPLSHESCKKSILSLSLDLPVDRKEMLNAKVYR